MLFCNTGLCISVPRQKIPFLFSVPAHISETPSPWTKQLLWNRHTVVLPSAYNLSDIAESFQFPPAQNSYPRSHPVLPGRVLSAVRNFYWPHIRTHTEGTSELLLYDQNFYSVHTVRLRYWSPSRQIPEMVPYGSYLFHTRLHSEKYSTHRYT